MSKATALLAITSLGLAASTAYLALELHAARRGSVARISAPEPAPSAAAKEARAVALSSAAAPTSVAASASVQESVSRNAEMIAASRAARAASDAHTRAMLADPDKRAKALRDMRKNTERDLPRLAQLLELSEDENSRLLDMLAEHNMRIVEAFSRCALNPPCDAMAVSAAQTQISRRELVELLGADKAQRLEDYRENFQERNTVARFRGDLPDALRLSDAQADKLADVLGEERRLMVKEWEQSGTSYSGIGNMYGSLLYPSTAKGVEQRVAEAVEFQRRQRERAAQVLTAGQLEAFTQRQNDMLEIVRGAWEYEVPSDKRD